jgi:hypothetical protein
MLLSSGSLSPGSGNFKLQGVFSPRAAWFLGMDLGALVGLVVLVVSTHSLYAPVSWPATIVADWFLMKAVGKEKTHRIQFERGVLQGYLIPVAIGLAIFASVGVYFLTTRGMWPAL